LHLSPIAQTGTTLERRCAENQGHIGHGLTCLYRSGFGYGFLFHDDHDDDDDEPQDSNNEDDNDVQKYDNPNVKYDEAVSTISDAIEYGDRVVGVFCKLDYSSEVLNRPGHDR
jgi:hypothetical protein